MEHNSTHTYLNVLDHFVRIYNNRPSSALGGLCPAEISYRNIHLVKFRKPKPDRQSRTVIKLGSYVRILREKQAFEKEVDYGYTDELFKVTQINRGGHGDTTMYKLCEYDETPIKGKFYAFELTPVILEQDRTFKIDKIIRKKRVNGVTQHLVSYRNWPNKYNSWVRLE